MTAPYALVSLLLALPEPTTPADPAPGGAPGGGFLGSFFPIFLVLIVVLLFAPLFSRKERDRKKRVGALKKHDRVVTSGGLFGTIAALDDQVVTLEVAKDVRVRVKRSSIFDVDRPVEGKDDAKGGS